MPIRSQFKTVAEFREALRDWFAGQALTGILACPHDYKGAEDTAERAVRAFEYADEMMKGRDK